VDTNLQNLVNQFKQEAADYPFITEAYLQEFCRNQSSHAINIPFFTTGGGTTWETLAVFSGWKIQWNTILKHVRIIDRNNIRQAWGSAEHILLPMLDYVRKKQRAYQLRNSNKLRYGIVFCGGGAKGAYQIGVWKRLRELGLDKEIIGVSGASIGAMNSLLFAQGDYHIAEEIWSDLHSSDFGTLNSSALQTVIQALNPVGRWLLPLNIKSWIGTAGLLNRDKLTSILYNNISKERIETTDKFVFTALTAMSMPHIPQNLNAPLDFVAQIEYQSWEHLPFTQIIETVLASAAYPGAYAPLKRNDKVYIDGGALDNSPAKPLVDAGFQNIIVIHLDNKNENQIFRALESRNVRFTHVWPSKSLGGIFEIGPSLTKSRIGLGWSDAFTQLIPMLNRCKEDDTIKAAQTHYELANEIYKESVRDAVLQGNIELFRAFLQTEKGQAMLRNYEYAADLGHEQAKKMVEQIHKL